MKVYFLDGCSLNLHLQNSVLVRSNFTDHRPADLRTEHSFPQFSKLSPKLRLMIWEQTWPASRMIEVAIFEDDTAEEYTYVPVLHFADLLSTLVDEDFGSRIVEGRPRELCSSPIALQACRESRMHTLIQYQYMEHTRSKQGSSYFNPYHDVLWLSLDFTDESEHLRDLVSCYGKQLGTIDKLHCL
jgi:hypothetical protein